MKILNLIMGLAVVISFSSCLEDADCVKGRGDYVSREFPISDFNEVSLFVPADVYITQDPSTSMLVEAQENVLDELDVEVKNNELTIGHDNCFKNMKKLKVHLSTPSLSKLHITGSGNASGIGTFAGSDFIADITGSGNVEFDIDVQNLNSHISGSGNITFTGNATNQTFEISGSGNISCFDLEGKEADVTINGSGKTEVNVDDELKVIINGSGNVYYIGNPMVDSNISGSGKVINAN